MANSAELEIQKRQEDRSLTQLKLQQISLFYKVAVKAEKISNSKQAFIRLTQAYLEKLCVDR